MDRTNVDELAARRAKQRGRCLTILLDEELPFPWHTIERGERRGGGRFDVYGWRTPPHARRAKRASTGVLATFASLEAALAAYPSAHFIAPVAHLRGRRGKART
ncbi:MAG TPA: hypothetical protein VIV54_16875 [Burkholderiales bacterium]